MILLLCFFSINFLKHSYNWILLCAASFLWELYKNKIGKFTLKLFVHPASFKNIYNNVKTAFSYFLDWICAIMTLL